MCYDLGKGKKDGEEDEGSVTNQSRQQRPHQLYNSNDNCHVVINAWRAGPCELSEPRIYRNQFL